MASASTSVVKGQKRFASSGLQVFRGALAVALVLHELEAELLALDERVHAGALDGRHMDEHVRLSAALLDEAKSLGGIEELYDSSIHDDFLSIDIEVRRLATRQTPYFSKLIRKIVKAR